MQEMSFGGMQEEMVGFCASLLALILGFYDRASGCYPHRVCYSLSHTHTQDCTFMQSHEHGHTELFHTLAQIHTGVYVYTAHIEVPQLVIHFELFCLDTRLMSHMNNYNSFITRRISTDIIFIKS